MYDRSIPHAHGRVLGARVLGRQLVREIHWRAQGIPADWPSAHRSARIAARVDAAREASFKRMYARGRCGL